MKIIKRVLLIFMTLLLVLVGLIYFYGPKFNLYLVPPSPRQYVKSALNNMDSLGIYTDSIEWQKTKKQTLQEAKNYKNYSETIPSLQKALKVAGGKHSFIVDNKEASDENHSDDMKPKIELNQKILLLHLPEFTGSEQEAKEYVNTLVSALQANNYQAIIVDLRGNGGGDMTPMLVGLSPILHEGTLFSYVSKDHTTTAVTLKNGAINSGDSVIKTDNTKKIKDIPIAVLIDENTGSSGELTALSFKGLPKVKFFGFESAGYTSANQSVHLYDEVTMQITTAFIKDRTNKLYENEPIEPDLKTSDAKTEAINWLKQIN